MDGKLFYSTGEAAEKLGCSRGTLYKRFLGNPAPGAPVLPVVKIGRSVRIHRDDLEAFAESLRHSAVSQHAPDTE